MSINKILPCVAAGLLALLGVTAYHIHSIDGIHWRVVAIVLNADTEYAKDYTHGAFRQIHHGQSKEAVLRSLGEPLFKLSAGKGRKERWIYSWSPSSTHYLYREIVLVDGAVAEKLHYFYFD